MNRKQYTNDTRYSRVLDNMDLLGIMDISTTRQHKNGTIVWRLPIKNNWNNGKLIEVASFSTGYVRNQNSGYSNYQLNKRQFEDEYFQAYEWKNDKQVKIPNQFRKWQRKTCILIPIEIDRLEYLISYCLKNYYIKRANEIANGDFVPKWKYDNLADAARLDYEKLDSFHDSYVDFNDSMYKGRNDRIKELEENLDDAVGTIVKHETYYVKLEDKLRDLENKLATIQRIADYE